MHPPASTSPSRISSRVVLAALAAALGGFLFGYDTAVIAGAIGYLRDHFHLGSVAVGWAGASAIVGCIPGALLSGYLGDHLGRRKGLLVCAVLYLVAALWAAVAGSFATFVVARFIGGLGVGASSTICPVYIAEISPRRHRGRLGTLFQVGIVVGIVVVFFVNLCIQRLGNAAWNADAGWRWMLASQVLPSAGFFVALLFVPESPRWLQTVGRLDEARCLLVALVGPEEAGQEERAVHGEDPEHQGSLGDLLAAEWRRPLVVAVGLAVLSQFSGINAIMYYAPEVFKAAGAGNDAAFLSSVWVGVVNLLSTFVAVAFVDRAGRRPLLLIGATVQVLALVYVGSQYHGNGAAGAGLLAGVLVFVAAFAMAMGPLPWVIISEIFPGFIRGRAASVGVFFIWVSCFLVAQTFPVLTARFGSGAVFWMFAGCSLASVFFVLLLVPETKGRSLEEISANWRR